MTALTSRPAETLGAAGVIGALIARVSGVTDADTLTYITVGVGLLPAVATTLVKAGGIRGLVRLLWRGKPVDPAPLLVSTGPVVTTSPQSPIV